MRTAQLFKEVYNYYPKDITPITHKAAYATAYANRKRSVRIKKELIADQWNNFVTGVKETLPAYAIKDQSERFHNKFCNYIDYYLPHGNGLHKVHILLSLLLPYHTIVITDFFGLDGIKMLDSDELALNDEVKQAKYSNEMNHIDTLLQKHFNTQKILMRDLNKIKVPGTYLQTKIANVTMFDLAFTNFFINFE